MYIVITGGGKVGEFLASVLLQRGNDVAIIEKNAKTADRLAIALEGSYTVICGDGCDSKYQEDAGIRSADVFVSTSGQDDDNLVACEIAQRVFGVNRCIARVNNPKNIAIFREVGIETVSATTLIASLIEEEALSGSVGVATTLTRGNVLLAEFVVPRMRFCDNEAGVLVSELNLPDGCAAVAVQVARQRERAAISAAAASATANGEMAVISADMSLFEGDKVVVAAKPDLIDIVRERFRNL